MPNIVLDLIIDRVDLVNAGANSAAFIELFKGKESAKHMDLEKILSELKPEHAAVVVDAIAKAKAEIPKEVADQLEKAMTDLGTALGDNKTLSEQLTELKKTREDDAIFEEAMKGLDPNVQEVLRKMQAKTIAAETTARQLQEDKEAAENLAKAKDLKALPIEETALADMLKGMSPEVIDLLQKANKLIEDSPAFTEVGKKATGGETGDDAWAKIEKKAQEIAAERGITVQAATSAVIKEFPQLYKDYLERSHE